jgi:hypothetical protein
MISYDSIQQKLAQYSAIAGSVLLAGSDVDAQIAYTNVDPNEKIFLDDVYNLDLDNDGIFDFKFTVASQVFGYWRVAEISSADSAPSQNYVSRSEDFFAAALNANDFIGSGNNWVKPGYYYGGAPYLEYYQIGSPSNGSPGQLYGPWGGKGDHYLGLKFGINGEYHYGWARLNVTRTASFLNIKAYAYNTVPGEPILAGQRSLRLDQQYENVNASEMAISVYPNPAKDKIVLSLGTSNLEESRVSIYDINGKEVLTSQFPELNADQLFEFDISTLPGGFYLLKLTSDQKVATQKFAISN